MVTFAYIFFIFSAAPYLTGPVQALLENYPFLIDYRSILILLVITFFPSIKSLFDSKRVLREELVCALSFCGLFALTYRFCKFPIEKVHLAEYVILTVGIFSLVVQRGKGKWALGQAFLWTFCVGVADELWQGILPSRYFDFRDIAINGISAFLGVLFIRGVLNPWGRLFRVFRVWLEQRHLEVPARRLVKLVVSSCLVLTSVGLIVVNDPRYKLWRAAADAEKGEYQRAIAVARKVLKEDPTSRQAMHLLLSSHLDRWGDFFKSKGFRQEPMLALRRLDRMYKLAGTESVSVASPAERVHFLETLARWYQKTGLFFFEDGNTSRGISSYYRAHFLYGELHQAEESRQVLSEVLRREPDFGDAYYQLARIDEGGGHHAAALQGYRRAVELVPTHLEALAAIVRLEDSINDYR
jgi:hypothetical protein